MNTNTNYIIVDDDPINNMLSTMAIETAIKEVSIRAFEDPEAGLAFIQNNFVPDISPTILLLDLNMPTLTGWQFLEEYDKIDNLDKDDIKIFMLSSSLDPLDMRKSTDNKNKAPENIHHRPSLPENRLQLLVF